MQIATESGLIRGQNLFAAPGGPRKFPAPPGDEGLRTATAGPGRQPGVARGQHLGRNVRARRRPGGQARDLSAVRQHGSGTLITHEHTPLIAHTANDIVTSETGLYGDAHGMPIANEYRYYTPG